MSNDPTTRPVGIHEWLRWREQQPDRPFADPELARDKLHQLACDELYGLALPGIVEFTGSPAGPAGLLGAWPAAILPEAIKQRHLIATYANEGHGAYVLLKLVPILVPRAPGVWPSYTSLTFFLAKPAAFAQYRDDLHPLPRPPIGLGALIDLLLNDEIFQRHRTEKLLPAANLLEVVAARRSPDLTVPRDSRVREALIDRRVIEMYGKPKCGQPPAWARALLKSFR